MPGLIASGLQVEAHVYSNEDKWVSLKLTRVWPTLSLWLQQAPWGTGAFDKCVVLQIKHSYCSWSASTHEGVNSVGSAFAMQLMLHDEGIHLSIIYVPLS